MARDYRDLVNKQTGRAMRAAEGEAYRGRDWWNKKGVECASAIATVVDTLRKAQTNRATQLVRSMRLYGNMATTSPGGPLASRSMASLNAIRERVTCNETAAIIDTVTSRIGETKPKPFYLTSGGDYRQERKAKAINDYIDGVYYTNKTPDIGTMAFRDAMILGDGMLHVYGRAGAVRHERVRVTEILVDELEAENGNPRRMYRVKLVDKQVLSSAFPDRAQDIARANMSNTSASVFDTSQMVLCVEAWNLGVPDEDGEVEGGTHALMVANSTDTTGRDGFMLVEPEEWPYECFPFAKIPWCERPDGYWSQGLCEQLQGDQIEMNKNLWMIQRSMHLLGGPKVWMNNASKIVQESLNNEIAQIIKGVGEPPQYLVPPVIQDVYFQNVAAIRERMRDRAGVSQMSMAGHKPQGADSGKALRTIEDIESDRFKTAKRYNDNLYLDVADLTLMVSREMARTGKLRPVRVPGQRNFKVIDFKKDIGDFKNENFVRKCYPVSSFTGTPAEQMQTTQEFVQAGWIDQDVAMELLDFPDLKSHQSLAQAHLEIISKNLDAIVNDGEYAPPEPTDDLQLAKRTVVRYIQKFRALDLEAERMELLQRWSLQVDELVQRAMPPAPMPAPGAPAGAPLAAPQAPPTSDLLPNAPGAAAAPPLH